MRFKSRHLAAFLLIAFLFSTVSPGLGKQAAKDKAARVLDGDTVVLSNQTHVRYIGVNAPELAGEDRPAQPFSEQAAAFNKRLVFQKLVRLETDKEEHDRYGRALAYVFLSDGTFVNEALILQGLAYCLPFPENTRYGARLLAAQRKAMKKGRGLWHDWKEPGHRLYIGNSRTMRFHLATCPATEKIGAQNRLEFKSMREAFHEGYAPCGFCLENWRKDKRGA